MSTPDALFKTVYKELNSISNILFTPREIDVIACVLSGKADKTIASILNITPRGVESHTRNIRRKIGCAAKDGIINFIEKSHKVNLLRDLYTALLEKHNFSKILQKMSLSLSQKEITCEIFCEKKHPEDRSFALSLKKTLQIAGIQAWIKNDVKRLTSQSPVLFIGSTEKFLEFKKDNPDISEKIFLIFLDPGKDFKENTSDYIVFEGNHDYKNFFNLLEQMDPESPIKDFHSEFDALVAEKCDLGQSSDDKKSTDNVTYLKLTKTLKKKVLIGLSVFFSFIIVLFLASYFFQSSKPLYSGNNKTSIKTPIIWNAPLKPNFYIKREHSLRTLWEKFKDPLAKIVGVFGLGGVGKTFLAIDYFHNNKQPYDFKAWFNAESPSLIKASYIKLGEKHNLFDAKTSEDLKVNEVKQWLEKQGHVLLVFDNAPNMETLEKFIPQNVHIIITSRNYKLPNSLEVGVMSPEEASNLLRNNLPDRVKKEKNFKADAKKLVEKLNYIPLAISQAAAYITETMVPLSRYLKLYSSERHHLLSSDIMPLGSKHEPIYVTWDISLEKLQQNPNSKKIIELLNFLSFCYSKDIPKNLLIHLLFNKIDNKTEVEFNNLMSIIRQYSLVKIDEKTLTIHQLVSHWIRDKVEKKKRPYYIKKIKQGLEKLYPKKVKNLEKLFTSVSQKDLDAINPLISHIETLLNKSHYLSSEEKLGLLTLAADAYYAVGAIQKSGDILERVLSIKRKFYKPKDYIKLTDTLYNLAFVYEVKGRYLEAERLLNEALSIYESQYGKNSKESVKILELLSPIYHALGTLEKRSKVLQKAIMISEKIYKKSHSHLGNLQRLLSVNFHLLGKFTESRDILSKALEATTKNHKRKMMESGAILTKLGWMNFILGQREEGKKIIDKSYTVLSKNYPPHDPQVVLNKIYSGLANYEMNNFKDSAKDFEETLKIRERYHGKQNIWTAFSQVNLALAYTQLKQLKESKTLLLEALNTIEKTSKAMSLWSYFLLNRIGNVFYLLGDNNMAISLITRAFKHVKEKYGENHIFSAIITANLGNIYRSMGKNEQGLSLMSSALKILEETYGPNHPSVGKALFNMSLAYSNNYKKQKELKKRGLQILEKFYPASDNYNSKDYIILLPF